MFMQLNEIFVLIIVAYVQRIRLCSCCGQMLTVNTHERHHRLQNLHSRLLLEQLEYVKGDIFPHRTTIIQKGLSSVIPPCATGTLVMVFFWAPLINVSPGISFSFPFTYSYYLLHVTNHYLRIFQTILPSLEWAFVCDREK